MTAIVHIARCPEHGLHGAPDACFVCGGPVDQVPMLPVEIDLDDLDRYDLGPFDPDELVRYAESYGHPEGWIKRAQGAHHRAEDLGQQVRTLQATIYGALVRFNVGENAQALSLLNGAIPDGYRAGA